jgi:hypothetical protein
MTTKPPFYFFSLEKQPRKSKTNKIMRKEGGSLAELPPPPPVTTFHIARSVRRDYRTPAPHDWPSKFKRTVDVAEGL